MGLVTAIEPQARHANRFNIYVDNQFVLGLSAILATRLRVGQTLTNDELKALEQEETFESAYEKALRFLEPRPRSTQEVKQQLLKKKFAGEIIESVIARLAEAGLLDDAAFAKYWVDNREQFKPRAARALRFELKRKGLSSSNIAEAVGADLGIQWRRKPRRACGTRAARRISTLDSTDWVEDWNVWK